jgi:hypothetical protein
MDDSRLSTPISLPSDEIVGPFKGEGEKAALGCGAPGDQASFPQLDLGASQKKSLRSTFIINVYFSF